MSTIVPGWFGKLPQHREYINRSERRLTEIGMREWLDAGVQLARSDLGPDGKGLFAALPQLRFVWPAPGGGYVTGCIDRGGDAAGRRYPFVTFTDVRDRSLEGAALPLHVGGLCSAFGELVGRAREAPDIASAQSLLDAGVEHAQPRPPEERYGEFAAAPAAEVLGSGGSSGVSRHQLVQGVVDALGVFRGQPPERRRVGARFRLAPRIETIDDETCFWLNAAMRVLGGQPLERITCLWTGGGEAYPSTAFLFFRPPSAAQFLGVLDPGRDVHSISRVDQAYDPTPPEERMAPALRGVVDDRGASFEDYLAALADRG